MKYFINAQTQEKIMYLIAGVYNTLFGYGLTAGLYSLLRNSLEYSIVLMISYIISVTNNYLTYKFIVFKTPGNYVSEYLRFCLVYGAVYVTNVGMLRLLSYFFTYNFLVTQAIFTVFIIVISYIGNKYFAFNVSLIKGRFVSKKHDSID